MLICTVLVCVTVAGLPSSVHGEAQQVPLCSGPTGFNQTRPGAARWQLALEAESSRASLRTGALNPHQINPMPATLGLLSIYTTYGLLKPKKRPFKSCRLVPEGKLSDLWRNHLFITCLQQPHSDPKPTLTHKACYFIFDAQISVLIYEWFRYLFWKTRHRFLLCMWDLVFSNHGSVEL